MAEKSRTAPSLMQCFTEYGSALGPLSGYGSPDANVFKWARIGPTAIGPLAIWRLPMFS
ncbi:hypothetical protein SPHINGOR109_50059 [Sphingorhabdus sp. 109]|nr:hypothetical protein SPHINGOR109_50059 [Sphingorhabdus sp. 109]